MSCCIGLGLSANNMGAVVEGGSFGMYQVMKKGLLMMEEAWSVGDREYVK